MEDTIFLTDEYVMNTYGRYKVAISHGEGVYLYDEAGNSYLDFTAGIAVNSLGYGNEKCIRAITEQIKKINHCSNLYYSRPMAEVAEILVKNTCFDKVFFCNSGAEATEAILKIFRKFGKAKNENCTEIITMKNSFHGRTLAAVTATGQRKYQKGFEPMLPNIDYAEFNNLDSVKSLINENTCGILVEPIQGEGGLLPATSEFLAGLRELCNKNDILLGFDEVQSGVGRTGELFAYKTYGVEPDVLGTAKGLANGIPIGACLAKEEAARVLNPGEHASTFGGNPVACASAKVVLSEILEQGILSNVQKTGRYLKEKLTELSKKHPQIKEVRGKGLMLGAEFTLPVKPITEKARENGLLILSAGTNVIRFVPPLVITEADTDEAIKILDKSIGEAL